MNTDRMSANAQPGTKARPAARRAQSRLRAYGTCVALTVGLLLTGCTPSYQTAPETTEPTTEAPTEPGQPSTTPGVRTEDPGAIIAAGGAFVVVELPAGYFRAPGEADEDGWVPLMASAQGCAVSVRHSATPGGDPTLLERELTLEHLTATARTLGKTIDPAEVGELHFTHVFPTDPRPSEAASAVVFLETKWAGTDGTFTHLASRVGVAPTVSSEWEKHALDIRYMCRSESAYDSSWAGAAETILFTVWMSPVWAEGTP